MMMVCRDHGAVDAEGERVEDEAKEGLTAREDLKRRENSRTLLLLLLLRKRCKEYMQ